MSKNRLLTRVEGGSVFCFLSPFSPVVLGMSVKAKENPIPRGRIKWGKLCEIARRKAVAISIENA